MKKKKLNKDIRKSIASSFGRFISIMFLMLLGSLALVGLAVTGPDMRETGKNYFKELNTADITIISDYGIDISEQEQIEKASNIKDLEYIYLKDVTIENENDSIRIFSKPEKISLYEITEGNLPSNSNEIAISDKYKEKYSIGDIIKFSEKLENDEEILKNHEFTIVGFLNSSEILSNLNLGETTVGTGSLNGYAVVNKEAFDSDVYMMAKLKFTDTENLDPYSEEYNNKIQIHTEELEKLLKEQQEIRLSNIKDKYQEEINNGQKKVDDAKSELEDARNELTNAKSKIDSAKKEISENETKLNNAKKEILSGEKQIENKENELIAKQKEYENGLNDYESNKIELENAEKQLSQTQTEYSNFINNTYTQGIEEINQFQVELDLKKEEFNIAKTQLEEADKELKSAKTQLDSGKQELQNAKTKLENAKKEYNSNKTKFENAKIELSKKEQEYEEKLAEFNEKEPEALTEIEDAEKELKDAKEKLEKIELPTYSVDNRRELPGGEGYSIYETVSEIVDSLARIFPVFLYFVAALVTLTTMARFVGDERINNGTLKALGYSDQDVIKKFTIYGLIAGTTGTVIGIILGHTLIPMIVYNAYKTGFTLPQIELHFHLKISILAVILSLLSSVLPARIIATKELKETTSSLLQPKAPQAGTKILLERIKLIWNKMKFTQKVTARNIFRYKKRMFMTIFGVAGAASILFAGFSVQYSISGINERQFEHIIKYDAIVALNDDLTDSEEQEINNMLNSDVINSYSSIYYEEVTKTAGKNNDKQSIKLIVPKNTEEFNKYISLMERKSGQNINLADDGVIISERLSTLLNINVGDNFTFIDSSDKERNVKVSGICEMYAGHFIFMNEQEYKNIYEKDLEINAKLLLLNDSSLENVENQSAKFMDLSGVKGVVQNITLYNQINTIVDSLNNIMLVLIIIAVLLAVVILYNLTNINVAERIRELCTIKVLGFHDRETTMYIYRETIFLSAIGIVVGWLIGIFLHNYILTVVPPDEVMFDPVLWIGAYIIPFVTITVVTFVLKFYVNNKLKNVDMLEALKSVD